MFVLGTAGHVDHGKSSLLQALTGLSPDRLPEEKRRGLTIEPNFLWLDVEGVGRIGFVDIPGHRRFVKNMVTGVASFDAFLFVVAADDGWMPQSEEHARILEALGIRQGLVVVTKTDLVDAAHLAEVKAEVVARWKETGLPPVPIVEFSTKGPNGLADVMRELKNVLGALAAPAASTNARIWIDRVFQPKGQGVVVTGTLKEGTLVPGDELWLWPSQERALVRSLQVHGREVPAAKATSRVAMGLATSAKVARGSLLAKEPAQISDYVEARIRFWRGPKRKTFEAALHLGTLKVPCRIVPLGKMDSTRPDGEEWGCRVKLPQAMPVRSGERFLLRAPSEEFSWGGGVVVDTRPPRQAKVAALARLAAYREGEREWGEYCLAKSGLVELAELTNSLFTSSSTEQKLCDTLRLHRLTKNVGASLTRWEKVTEPLGAALLARDSAWTAEEVTKLFLGEMGERRPHLVDVDSVVTFLEKQRVLIRVGKGFYHPKQVRSVSPVEGRWREEALTLLEKSPEPVSLKEWYRGEKPKRELIHQMAREGVVVSLSDDHFLGASQMEKYREKVTGLLNKGTGKSTVDLKEALGLTRKNAVLILEKLDRDGVTYFQNNLRRLTR